jgi:gluconolactonase
MPIEQVSPELERIVSLHQDIEELGRGYLTAEGPVWYSEGRYFLFSDIRHNRRMKWAPGEGISLFYAPTHNANGLTRDRQGRLIACEHTTRRVTRLEPDGSITVVAHRYQGTQLNRPNDVVVKSDGSMYFTDPGAPDPELDLDFAGVYRVSPDLGTVTLLVRDFVTPNGLAFSPDESILYIDDSRRRHIRAFDMQPNGMLALATDRVFCELKGARPGVPDGMKVDVAGNVYCTGPGGVWLIEPSGRHLGTILTGAEQTTNCAWGGEDWQTLLITTRDTVARVHW